MAFEGNTWWTYLIFSVIAFIALLGNGMVLYVLVTRATTYLKLPYNIFIFSLAVTDIMSAVFLVFSRYLYFPPGHGSPLSWHIYCKTIWSAWFLFTLGYISIYTCTALTVERWLAVHKPIVYRTIKRSQVIKAIILVWLWGILINTTTLFRVKFDQSKQQCSWMSLPVGNDVFAWVDFTLQSIIPFSTMVALYCHILYTMRLKLRHSLATANQPMKKVTRVAMAASAAIIIGWLPSRISFMLSKYGLSSPSSLLHFCLVILSLSNSCINPFLYGIYSAQFRNEYSKIFYTLFRCKNNENQTPNSVFTTPENFSNRIVSQTGTTNMSTTTL